MHDPIIDKVLVSLRRIIRATDLHSRNLIKTSSLTTPQLLILQALARSRELSVGELAQELNVSQATTSSILDRLEKRGLIERAKSDQDRRRTVLSLSAAGQTLVAHAPIPLHETFVSRFQALEEWEQSQILSALQRVAQMMDARDLDASPVLDVGTLDREPL
jgi:DNA-binding MarR family transcriptional regulator